MALFWNKKEKINSPANGLIKDLSTLKDGVFSEKMLGVGFVVEQTDGKVYAPIGGTLETVFPTKHAYGIKTKDGLSILIHIGIDTVNLNGEGFKSFVEQGQKVKQGDLLAEVDLNLLKNKKVVTDVICVVTTDSKVQVDEQKIKTSGQTTINEVVIDL